MCGMPQKCGNELLWIATLYLQKVIFCVVLAEQSFLCTILAPRLHFLRNSVESKIQYDYNWLGSCFLAMVVGLGFFQLKQPIVSFKENLGVTVAFIERVLLSTCMVFRSCRTAVSREGR